MTVPCTGPCQAWIDLDYLKSCGPCSDLSSTSDDTLTDFINVASDLLYQWSAKQFSGFCRDVIRPCNVHSECGCSPWGAAYYYSMLTDPGLSASAFYPISCGCSSLHEIDLPFHPVTSINSITVDGVVLDDSVYRIDEWKKLVRLADPDGTNPGWPCCQDLSLASTEENTWEIDLNYGRPPPISGKVAARALACEMALACDPSVTEKKCRLPRNAVSIVRQGVSVVRQNPGLFQRGPRGGPVQTGLWEVEAFLSAYNPYGKTSRGVVLSPDLPDQARRVGT